MIQSIKRLKSINESKQIKNVDVLWDNSSTDNGWLESYYDSIYIGRLLIIQLILCIDFI